MGYQESWFYITPQSKFNDMIRACAKLEREGRYERISAYPTDVVTLKEPMGGLPAGSKVLWVCGERCFQSVEAMLDRAPPARPFRRCEVQIIPVEAALTEGQEDPRRAGIDFDAAYPSENASMRRESFERYSRQLQERQMCH